MIEVEHLWIASLLGLILGALMRIINPKTLDFVVIMSILFLFMFYFGLKIKKDDNNG